MVIQVVTLFPEMFDSVWGSSIIKRARMFGQLKLATVPLRAFGIGPHHMVDDYPFGGAVGMLMRADVVVPAVEWAIMHEAKPAHVILTSPQGQPFTQRLAEEFSHQEHLIIVAGHYEGIDDRVRVLLNAQEVSVGDVVLTGGEVPSMMMVDAVTRLLPGVLGGIASTADDSFSRGQGWLEGPQYTRPVDYRHLKVPSVLTQGNHAAISEYRDRMAHCWTKARRPDLLDEHD